MAEVPGGEGRLTQAWVESRAPCCGILGVEGTNSQATGKWALHGVCCSVMRAEDRSDRGPQHSPLVLRRFYKLWREATQSGFREGGPEGHYSSEWQ